MMDEFERLKAENEDLHVKQDLLFAMLNLTLVAWKNERDRYTSVTGEYANKKFTNGCEDIGVLFDNSGEFSKKAALDRFSAMLDLFESGK